MKRSPVLSSPQITRYHAADNEKYCVIIDGKFCLFKKPKLSLLIRIAYFLWKNNKNYFSFTCIINYYALSSLLMLIISSPEQKAHR